MTYTENQTIEIYRERIFIKGITFLSIYGDFRFSGVQIIETRLYIKCFYYHSDLILVYIYLVSAWYFSCIYVVFIQHIP